MARTRYPPGIRKPRKRTEYGVKDNMRTKTPSPGIRNPYKRTEYGPENNMRTKTAQLWVMAVAAPAVFAVAAALLLAGGATARAGAAATIAPDPSGDNYLPPEQVGIGPGALPRTGDNDD